MDEIIWKTGTLKHAAHIELNSSKQRQQRAPTQDGLSSVYRLFEAHVESAGDTLGRFRNLLIRHGLQEQLFTQVVVMLMERDLILKKGTIVDSTIISAPSSTKHREKKRDPDSR